MTSNPTSAPSLPWFVTTRTHSSPLARLFCFPYAGGSAFTYRHWQATMLDGIEVVGVELPGRQRRLSESPITDFDTLVDMLHEEIVQYLDKPFAFFGHSMGALLCFELAKRLRAAGDPMPFELHVSAAAAPEHDRTERKRSSLSSADLIEELRTLGGTPPEILNEPEIIELYLPCIRADFAAVESFRHRPEAPLDIPLRAYGGTTDTIAQRHIADWEQYTCADFSLSMIDGGHFFLDEGRDQLISTLSAHLACQLARLSRRTGFAHAAPMGHIERARSLEMNCEQV